MRSHFRLRTLELALLLFAGGIVIGGFCLLSVAQTGSIAQSYVKWPAAYVLSTIALSLWISWAVPRADQIIFPVVALIAGIGTLVVTRLDASLGHKQLVWILLGEAAAAVAMVVPRRVGNLRLYKYTWATAGLLLIVLTIIGGTDINGSGYRRWIGFHGFYLQPVELLKILMAIFFAAYLDEKHELLSAARLRLGRIRLPPFQYLAPLALMWGISLILLVKQNDLGSALLFLGIFLAMIYVGTARAVYPVSGIVMFAVGVYAAFHLFPHVRDRTEVWLDPFTHASTSGYQIIQGLIALGSGGIGGQGLGQGFPTDVPVVTTDFILSAIGEELGLAGITVLLMLLLYVVFRGLAIATSADGGFEKLLATGLMATIAIQTLVIVGGTIRLMPLTGVPLPFLSYGGSSSLANYIMIALLLRISAEARAPV
jgi:cell division protein FtsW (lipid II flippase)